MSRILVYEHLCAGGLRGSADEAELLPQGRSMRDAVLADLLALPPAQVGRVTLLQASEQARPVLADDRVRTLVLPPGADPLAQLAAQVPAHDAVWAIAPETGGLLQACQRAAGPRWLGSSAAALAICASKTATRAQLAAAGLAVPADEAGADAATRAGAWVVKPDDGAGCSATQRWPTLASAQADAAARRAAGEAVSLQAWVDGEPLSLTLLVQAGRAELLALNRQHILRDDKGLLRYAGLTRLQAAGDPLQRDARWPAMQRLAARLAAALPGLQGYVGVDLIDVDAEVGRDAGAHEPVVIEVNARTSCAYVGLSARLGRNLAGEILALHAPTREVADALV